MAATTITHDNKALLIAKKMRSGDNKAVRIGPISFSLNYSGKHGVKVTSELEIPAAGM